MAFIVAGSSPKPPSTAGSRRWVCHSALGRSGAHLGTPKRRQGLSSSSSNYT